MEIAQLWCQSEAIRNKAMEQALKQTNPSSMKTSMRTAKFAAEAAEVRGKVLNEKHEELARHMGKKPRGKWKNFCEAVKHACYEQIFKEYKWLVAYFWKAIR